MERETDVVVIGAGPVGENVADRAHQGGLEAIIVEHELVGGECSYWACVPSKTLLRSAAALRAAQRVPGAAEAITGELDVATVLRRRDEWVADWDDAGQVSWLDGAGIELVRGHARLDGPKRVVVTGADGSETVLVARHAVAIATGSEPIMPPVEGLAEARPWTSREAMAAKRAPKRLAIIGGGVVGVEVATAYAGFGSEVTVLARHGLLGGFEAFAGESVVAGLQRLGARVLTGAEPVRVYRGGGDEGAGGDEADAGADAGGSADAGAVTIELGDGRLVVADEVLVATGRRPRIGTIGLETVGLEPGSGIDVDDTMLALGVDGEWLYAVGDVNGRALLTHQGKYQARAAGDVIAARAVGGAVDTGPWGVHVATADHVAVPQLVFSEPEVAAVGLTEQAARAAGRRVRAVEYEIGHVTGAGIHAEGYEGRAKLIVDLDAGIVVGATFAGQDVGELLQSATIAIVGRVPIDRLWHAVPAYPTISEIWLRLLETLGRPKAGA